MARKAAKKKPTSSASETAVSDGSSSEAPKVDPVSVAGDSPDGAESQATEDAGKSGDTAANPAGAEQAQKASGGGEKPSSDAVSKAPEKPKKAAKAASGSGAASVFAMMKS